MITYTFDFSDIDKLRDYYKSQLDPKGDSDRISFPKEVGEGYLSYYKISPEVFLLVNNYKAHQNIKYIRQPIDENDLIIHFRKYALDHKFKKNEVLSNYSTGYTPGNMRCIDAKRGETVYIPKGAEVKSTMIVLKSSYIKPYFMKSNKMAEKIDRYIRDSHKHIDKFYFSYQQSILFDQIVNPDFSRIENYLYFIARGIRLLETFWKDVRQWESAINPFSINSNQVGNIFKVSGYLERNLHEPFIGVDQLANMASMSRTYFFNMFKEIHNQTPLEFFNNKRLESSYNMIFSQGLTIKEVMDNLNYSNSSKFRKAFFNKFDIYPDFNIK